MKNKAKYLFIRITSFMLVVVNILLSCGGSDSVGEEDNTKGKSLAGTKWTTTNWDFSVGDDWASILDETYNVYFYSQTEGIFYYGRKDLDSDFGSSSSRCVAHFTYEVEDGVAILDYINNPK